MKRDGASFATRLSLWFATVVIVLSVSLFLAAYFVLYRAVQERAHEVVEAKLQVCRAWYGEGGLPALRRELVESGNGGKEAFFVRLIGPRREAGGRGLQGNPVSAHVDYRSHGERGALQEAGRHGRGRV